MTCEVAGCPKPHHAHGLCNRHYRAKRKHGDPCYGEGSEDATMFAEDLSELVARSRRNASYPLVLPSPLYESTWDADGHLRPARFT